MMMNKMKTKPISLILFFFLPSSLFFFFSLLLFLLAWNGLLLSHHHYTTPYFLPSHKTHLPSSSILSLKQEISPPSVSHIQSKSKPQQQVLVKPNIDSRRSPSSSRRRSRSLSRSILKSLHPTPQSSHFSSRAAALFNSSQCTLRFFMTWISSLHSFGKRELFAIETLFKSHPNACLLIASSAMDSPHGRSLLQPFSTLGFRIL